MITTLVFDITYIKYISILIDKSKTVLYQPKHHVTVLAKMIVLKASTPFVLLEKNVNKQYILTIFVYLNYCQEMCENWIYWTI